MPEDNERRVKREVTLHANREEVWEALTDPELAEQWLADEAEVDAREGGEVVLRYAEGEERRGRVREAVPHERLRVTWWRESTGPSEVEFVLADAAVGTRLVVVESAPAPTLATATAIAGDDRLLSLEVLLLCRLTAALAVA